VVSEYQFQMRHIRVHQRNIFGSDSQFFEIQGSVLPSFGDEIIPTAKISFELIRKVVTHISVKIDFYAFRVWSNILGSYLAGAIGRMVISNDYFEGKVG